MARANRHFIPGHIWHLTHRCHKREFLLRFSKVRNRWIELLLEAKQRYHLSILNFNATRNHIHLILFDASGSESIPRAMQFIAGRIAQEYNRRKNRQGAFWQDRYHATAIESGEHLWRCLVYVDLNMVRAGVMDHPCQWKWSGYHEIQKAKIRYRLIDHSRLLQFLNTDTQETLARAHKNWIESQLNAGPERQEHFSKSIAVGSKPFIQKVQQALGTLGIAKRMAEAPAAGYQLKEATAKYGSATSNLAESHQSVWPVTNTIPWKLEKTLNL
jgi:REP element-mobilizing transposase RayT